MDCLLDGRAYGGALSVVASSYGFISDFQAADASLNTNDYRFAILVGTRAWFQGVSIGLSALTTLSYCSPLITLLGKRIGENLAGKVIGSVATRLLAARAALVFARLEVSIFLLAVTVIIWYFEDDALQKWCDRSAFGSHKDDFADAYRDATKQLEAYTQSLKDAL
jgi:hypothetical protein